jgi:peptide/nickel transport system permease protein
MALRVRIPAPHRASQAGSPAGRRRLAPALAHVARRLAQALVVVWGVSLVAFVVARLLPGNPVYLIVGANADEQTIAEATQRLGLDESIPQQYWNFLKGLLTGDLGTSWTTANPVTTDIAERLPATLELGAVALLFALLMSIPLGVTAALRPRGPVRRAVDVLTAGGVAIPQFWLGLMLIYFFYFRLGWAPPPLGRLPGASAPEEVTGFLLIDSLLAGDLDAWLNALHAILLPAITLALTIQPPLLRLVQVTMTRTLESDPIRTARAMGLSFRSVVYHDALRLVLLPILNMVGLLVGIVLSSSVLVETVFAWPGIGLYAVQAINASDYAALQGVVLVSAVVYVTIYVLIDVVQIFVDPRLRAS